MKPDAPSAEQAYPEYADHPHLRSVFCVNYGLIKFMDDFRAQLTQEMIYRVVELQRILQPAANKASTESIGLLWRSREDK